MTLDDVGGGSLRTIERSTASPRSTLRIGRSPIAHLFAAQDPAPRDPRDWPKGKMVYLTYGNEGARSALMPMNARRTAPR